MSPRKTRRTGKRSAGSSRRALLWGVPVAGLALVLGALTIAFIDANWRFSRQSATPPVRVLSAAFSIREDMHLSREDLVARLQRLGYRQVERRPSTPGEYALRFRSVEI